VEGLFEGIEERGGPGGKFPLSSPSIGRKQRRGWRSGTRLIPAARGAAAAGVKGKRERGGRGFHPRPHLGPRWIEGGMPTGPGGGGARRLGVAALGLGRRRAVEAVGER
jgi:hypothetical protein